MKFLRVTLFIIPLLLNSVSFAVWSVKSHYEKVANSNINKSVVEFKAGSNIRKEYRPQQPPWGMVDNQRFVLGDRTYFATAWAKGAASVLYRIFDMSISRTEPVCELTSFAERTNLRLKDSYIQAQILNSKSDEKIVWKNCNKIN